MCAAWQIQSKLIGNKICQQAATVATLPGLVRVHHGDLPGIPVSAKDCLVKIGAGMTSKTIGDFCKGSGYTCAPPTCSDDDSAMLKASSGFGGGPYNCSQLKAANFCPASAKRCCKTCNGK